MEKIEEQGALTIHWDKGEKLWIVRVHDGKQGYRCICSCEDEEDAKKIVSAFDAEKTLHRALRGSVIVSVLGVFKVVWL